jgi:hypothetical protein
MTASGSWLLLLALAIGPSACLQTVLLERGRDGGTGDGANFNGADGGGLGRADGRDWCPGAEITRLNFSVRSPVVVIAFDRSSSMNSPFGAGTRLSVEQQLLRTLMMMYQGAVQFGYLEFPAGASCGGSAGCCASDITLPRPGNAAAVGDAMNACMGSSTGCVTSDATPTASAIGVARQFYGDFGGKDRYVLLTTDGEPSCTKDGSVSPANACMQAASEIAMLSSTGVRTIVVGVGEDVGNSACLDKMARAGGAEPSTSSPFYYAARDPLLLTTQLSDIVRGLAKNACHIDIDPRSAPADPTRIELSLKGVSIPRDPANKDGWNFDGGSSLKITIYGPSCDKLLGFDPRNDVDVITSGCPLLPK